MKQVVVFSSKGGNTRKLAEAAFSRLAGDKDIFPVESAPDPAGYDVVLVAFWFHGGQPDPETQSFLGRCAEGSRVFLIGSHGAAPDSDHVRIGMNKARELAGKAEVIGTFNCQGEVPEQILENAANQDPQPDWLEDAYNAKGHPNDDDIYSLCMALEQSGVVECRKPSEKRLFS